MSNLVSAMSGARHTDGIATIAEVSLQGMITLRGNLADPAVKNAATGIGAVDMPAQGKANMKGARGIAWMSPDELLVLCPYEEVAESMEQMRKTLGVCKSLVVDVSDARASFTVSGKYAREVMAKLVPVNLAPGAFEPGMFRRTRMAQVAAAFWMVDADTFQIVCFRSVAQYVFDVLKVAAQSGSEVDYF